MYIPFPYRKGFRTVVVALMLFALLRTASGFDTYWHTEAARRVGDEFGFSEDSRKVMQLGNFSPDFFGPVSDFASQHLQGKALAALQQFGSDNAQARDAAIFLHFDNLNGELESNAKFDSLFTHLLQNTQNALAAYNKRTDVDERTRKVLILITLGASLHAVQDFYSHSDWIHHDFNSTETKPVALPSGGSRAPTWFEFRARAGDPAKWPFQTRSGLYPPAPGVANTHTHMNHDNSRLVYREEETPGRPLVSQAQYHNAGNVPARENDAASAAAHQQFAFNTAVAASSEWVRKIEENAGAKAAIEFAKGWNLKLKEPKLAKELEAGLAVQLALSCLAGKWDGEDPPADRGVLCKTMQDQSLGAASGSGTSSVESIIMGTVARVAFPLSLKYTGKFWDVHRQYHVLEALTQGIASPTRSYDLK
jgi:hypothetical protein